jgi:hypothetical protein
MPAARFFAASGAPAAPRLPFPFHAIFSIRKSDGTPRRADTPVQICYKILLNWRYS